MPESCKYCGSSEHMKITYYNDTNYEGKKQYRKRGTCTCCDKYHYTIILHLSLWKKFLWMLGLYKTDYQGYWGRW